jgi:hypothetical protein
MAGRTRLATKRERCSVGHCHLRVNGRRPRELYQCRDCGRLYCKAHCGSKANDEYVATCANCAMGRARSR